MVINNVFWDELLTTGSATIIWLSSAYENLHGAMQHLTRVTAVAKQELLVWLLLQAGLFLKKNHFTEV